MTNLTPKEEMSSTVIETTKVNYIEATPDHGDTVVVLNTTEIIPTVRSVSSSNTTGEVKLRLSPREMPNKILNINSL